MIIKSNEELLKLSIPIIQDYLYEQLPINIFVSDKNGYIIFGNTRVVETLKETKETFIGSHLSKWGEENWNNCKKVIETGLEYKIEEIGLDNHVYLTNRKPFFEKDKSTVAGIIGVSLDITEEKQAEVAKQVFITNMAHDLRTPFCGIISLAQLQKMGTLKTSEDVKDYGRMIHESGEQLLEILNTVIYMLDKNKIDTVTEDELDLYEFAMEMQAIVTPAIYVNELDFELRIDKNIGKIVIDKIKLTYILINLLSNAIKFTPKGKITLSFYLIKSDKLQIEVADTGIGIHQDHHERIFKEFEKIKPSYENPTFTGCGIGLYLVKEYLEKLNGEISLTSSLGKGSTFKLEIPLPTK